MKKRVLISGGSGLIGRRLTKILQEKGYDVAHLSRSAESSLGIQTIVWDVENQELDHTALEGFHHIINLAGAGIVDQAWSDKRKKVIKESRTKSLELLFRALSKVNQKPQSFVSASAVGYYGLITTNKIFKEEAPPGNDFLANTCIVWEESIDKVKGLNIPTAKIRIGIVLSKEGGALKEIARPVKMGVGSALGTGKQYMPWIHIDDLCLLFIHAMEKNLEGAYNGAAPNQVNNKQFIKTLAKVLNKPLWLPNVPAFIMKLILGSRALLVLEGSRISTEKVEASGFEFTYKHLDTALKEIYY